MGGMSKCIRDGMARFQHVFLLGWVALLAVVFALVEIQIEGAAGWAANLPTWRIEGHPLLDIFWGGRAMTGYHLYVFLFMFLVFHLPFFICGRFSLKLEARAIGCLMMFWLVEDFMWFVINPAFGFGRFDPEHAPWHRHWALGVPTDYLVFIVLGAGLIWYSYRGHPGPSRKE